MRRAGAATAIGVALIAGLTGCAQPPSPLELAAKRLAAAEARTPAGYTDLKRGLSYRWSDRACTTVEGRCRIVDLYAWDTCDDGYLEGALLDRRGREVGVVNGTVDIARAGDRDRMTVEWTSRKAVDVRITDLECR